MADGISPERVARAAAILDEAALQPDTLSTAMERASEAIGVHSLYLIRLDGTVPEFIAPPSQAALAPPYATEGWWQIDERTARTRVAIQRTRGIIRDQDTVPDEMRRHSVIYNEFYRPNGIDYCTGWTVALDGETWAWALQRDARSGAVTDAETSTLAAAAPSFNRAAMMAMRLRNMHAKGAAEGLNAAGHPAIVLDHLGGCMLVTEGASDMFDAAFGVRLGRVWAANAKASAGLNLLASIAARRLDRVFPPNVLVERDDGRRPILVFPLPVRGVGLDALPGARLILMLVDLEARPQPAADILRAAFGLTPAETQLAQRMSAGEHLQSISEAMGVQIATVRHMTKSIFTKTGVHRQAELAVLLARIPGAKVEPNG